SIVKSQIQEEQCGFRPGRGTVDQLFTLAWILEGAWKYAQPVYMCFFCGPGKRQRPCPLRCPVGGAAGVWGTELVDMGYPVPVQPKPELSASSALNQTCFQWALDSTKAALCHQSCL
ncbi:hypothetical protein LDENG_00012290, partial [Lucifuga dentata]